MTVKTVRLRACAECRASTERPVRHMGFTLSPAVLQRERQHRGGAARASAAGRHGGSASAYSADHCRPTAPAPQLHRLACIPQPLRLHPFATVIAVIVPAHDQADYIDACLASIAHSSRHPLLRDEMVQCFVALDACSDRTGFIAHRRGATLVVLRQNSLGAARALGARAAIAAGARWLAFIDADCLAAPDWLAAQLDLRADAVSGTVLPRDGRGRDAGAEAFPHAGHDCAHRALNSANIGVSTAAYLRAGGCEALMRNHNEGLVGALRDAGVIVARSSRPRVWIRDKVTPDLRGNALHTEDDRASAAPRFAPAVLAAAAPITAGP